jgi:hypothetical protein
MEELVASHAPGPSICLALFFRSRHRLKCSERRFVVRPDMLRHSLVGEQRKGGFRCIRRDPTRSSAEIYNNCPFSGDVLYPTLWYVHNLFTRLSHMDTSHPLSSLVHPPLPRVALLTSRAVRWSLP